MSLPASAREASPYASESYLTQLLAKAVSANASDVHLKVGQPPGARVRGEIVYFRAEPLKPQDTEHVARHLIRDPAIRDDLADLREHDTAFEAKGVGRFRVNIYRQKGTLAIVMRAIPFKIPTFEDLGAPEPSQGLCEKDRG